MLFLPYSEASPKNLLYCLYKIHFIYVFVFGVWGSWLLRGLYSLSSCEQGLVSSCSAQASHFGWLAAPGAGAVGRAGLCFCGMWLSGCGSQGLSHRLNSSGARAQLPFLAHGIFLDQDHNCVLCWQEGFFSTEPPKETCHSVFAEICVNSQHRFPPLSSWISNPGIMT